MADKNTEIERLKARIQDLTDRLHDLTSDEKEEFANYMHKFVENVKDKSQYAWDRANEKREMAEKYIQKNPWKSAGIAAAAGFILGIILGKKNKD